MEKMFVRPRNGLKIKDNESGRELPQSGGLVPRSSYWLRVLADGDIEFAVQSHAKIGAPAKDEPAESVDSELMHYAEGPDTNSHSLREKKGGSK